MAERGRSPGAKGTAFPFAQRPQRSGPSASGRKILSLPAHLQKNAGPAGAGADRPAGSAGKPVGKGFGKPVAGAAGKPGKTAAPTAGKPRQNAADVPGKPPRRRDAATPASDAKPSDMSSAAEAPARRSSGPRPTARPVSGDRDVPRRPAAAPKKPQAADRQPARAVAPKPAASEEKPARPVEGVRVSKLLAERGLCSRRDADRYIERGLVFVNGERVSELGVRASPDAEITLAGEARQDQARQVTLLLHKPVGYVSGQPEPGYQPAVALIGADNQQRQPGDPVFSPAMLRGLAPAGRLDIDSTGLLVLTQDGRIARQLIGEHSEVDKEYLVRVEGELADNGLALLRHGLELDGVRLKPAQVEWLNDDQLRFVLREGRKRQIRRMCELVGLKVVGLKRVRMGKVRLGDLPVGQWRLLRAEESF